MIFISWCNIWIVRSALIAWAAHLGLFASVVSTLVLHVWWYCFWFLWWTETVENALYLDTNLYWPVFVNYFEYKVNTLYTVMDSLNEHSSPVIKTFHVSLFTERLFVPLGIFVLWLMWFLCRHLKCSMWNKTEICSKTLFYLSFKLESVRKNLQKLICNQNFIWYSIFVC